MTDAEKLAAELIEHFRHMQKFAKDRGMELSAVSWGLAAQVTETKLDWLKKGLL